MAGFGRQALHARFLVSLYRQETGNERKRKWKRNAKNGNEHGNACTNWKRAGNEKLIGMETNGTKTPTLVSFPTPSETMIIPFQKLPDSIKPEAAAAMIAGKTWFHWGNQADHPGDDELNRWIPAPSGNGFAGICGTDSASPAGNKSSGAMLRNDDISRNREPVPHAKKRFLADCLIAAKPKLSNRELARFAGVSHTFISSRRRIAQSGNKSA